MNIVNFLSSLFTLLLLSFFLYLKSVPIYVIVHVYYKLVVYGYVHAYVYTCLRRKKERSKQGQTNKQGKATQHTQGSHFS